MLHVQYITPLLAKHEEHIDHALEEGLKKGARRTLLRRVAHAASADAPGHAQARRRTRTCARISGCASLAGLLQLPASMLEMCA